VNWVISKAKMNSIRMLNLNFLRQMSMSMLIARKIIWNCKN